MLHLASIRGLRPKRGAHATKPRTQEHGTSGHRPTSATDGVKAPKEVEEPDRTRTCTTRTWKAGVLPFKLQALKPTQVCKRQRCGPDASRGNIQRSSSLVYAVMLTTDKTRAFVCSTSAFLCDWAQKNRRGQVTQAVSLKRCTLSKRASHTIPSER